MAGDVSPVAMFVVRSVLTKKELLVELKCAIFTNWLKIHSNVVKLKTKSNSIIFGGCRTYKSGLRNSFTHPKCQFLVPKNWHFCQKCPMAKDAHLYKAFTTDGWILGQFLKMSHLSYARSSFP